jgi:hypothetical protein
MRRAADRLRRRGHDGHGADGRPGRGPLPGADRNEAPRKPLA